MRLPTEVFHIKCIVVLCTKGRVSDCHKRGRYGKLVVCLSTDSGYIRLDCVLLAAIGFLRFLWEIVAVSVVSDSYGAAEEAGGPAEVAGAGVSDVVIATDGLLRQQGYWTRCCAAHDAVSAVGLVGHTGVSSWTHHVGA